MATVGANNMISWLITAESDVVKTIDVLRNSFAHAAKSLNFVSSYKVLMELGEFRITIDGNRFSENNIDSNASADSIGAGYIPDEGGEIPLIALLLARKHLSESKAGVLTLCYDDGSVIEYKLCSDLSGIAETQKWSVLSLKELANTCGLADFINFNTLFSEDEEEF